jgi:hypothetical protein
MENRLQLSLKKKWFEMTKSGIKTEDYREITPYWASRLLLSLGEEKCSANFWKNEFVKENGVSPSFYNLIEKYKIWTNTKKFTTNTMTLGYPKSTDTERIIKFEHGGIEIRTGNPEWGAEPNKLYFVIKHGKRL